MFHVEQARAKGFDLLGCNLAYRVAPDIKLLYGCNLEFWDEYAEEIDAYRGVHGFECWTTNRQAALKHGLNRIDERAGMGLCTEPDVIHHGHGSGYSLVSMAHKKGYERVLLMGYDLKYAPNYDGKARQVGSGPRHFFGEYPAHLQHWPSVHVKDGVHVELVELYKSIHDQGLIELINCTPGSALTGVIPSEEIADVRSHF